jgi:putative molybdopterin biosynthesis protein
MDGFAVRADDTAGTQPSSPVILPVEPSGNDQSRKCARYLDTGDLLPEGFNAVIPIENVESLDSHGEITSAIRNPDSIRIRAAVTPWSHIRTLGEDIVQTQLVLPSGQILRPVDLGAVAAAGLSTLTVTIQPRVAIIPTGTELVPIGYQLKPGDILEFNSLILAAQIKAWGGIPTRFPITPDDFKAICTRVEEASRDHDLILLNAGSSAGKEDFSARVVENLGTLLVHGIAVRPGHPVILGLIRKNTSRKISSGNIITKHKMIPIIGVPGFPVSATLTGEIFIEPLIARWTGRHQQELPKAEAYLTRKITSPAGDDDYVRVSLGMVGDKLLAAPLARGAGVISSLVRADGLMLIRRGIQGFEAGEKVEVSLYRTIAELNRTIFCIGSHDMTLDLMAQFLSENDRRLISSNVGSLGGIIALKRGEAHMAGSHLLDPETGEYNLVYIQKYLIGIRTMVYGFVGREQGLIVKRGNPKGIKNLNDLIRTDIHIYLYRQQWLQAEQIAL